jgi:hypothetical protein
MATEKVSSPIQAASTDLSIGVPSIGRPTILKQTKSFLDLSSLTKVRSRDSTEITWRDMRVNGSLLPIRLLRLCAGLRQFRTLVNKFLSGR